MKQKTYSKGSIIKFENNTLTTISIVDRVDPPYLWCKTSMCKIGDDEWKDMKLIDPNHNAEMVDSVSIITVDEFDAVIQEGIIPRTFIKNVEM